MNAVFIKRSSILSEVQKDLSMELLRIYHNLYWSVYTDLDLARADITEMTWSEITWPR